ncbi:fatty-acid oxidation protein subunit alpha [Hymenobacter sp. 5516J-16]|uniref:element excision factor XisH family protein n=1 Tax=Hymenobacter sp. 5516J-16 TaxID=2932253 RepID=UPI001FD4E142|nr:element excision factor XisH family protein [Hymenobacter sp. 5516J-16]UOQ76760.1 fatty-acid oxidation protein subunit alpha [Hymenobacter sp. 5516J-16]
MARKDFYHDCVRRALLKEGWTITHEPLILPFADTRVEVDLGAQLATEGHSAIIIAVEVKNFLAGRPVVSEYQKSYGQYQLYRELLSRFDPTRTLYLAVSEHAYQTIFHDDVIRTIVRDSQMKLLVFDPLTETITQWNP